MNASIRNSRKQYEQVQQEALAASARFRSNSRFYVQPASGNSWAVVGATDNRLYGQRRRYFDAVTYAESLERAVIAKSVPVITVTPPDDVRTRWAALWALVLIIMGGAFAS